MTELRKCSCGGEPFIYNPTDTGYEEDYIGDYYCVECEKCGRISETFDTEEEAIEAWNKRVGEVAE